MQKHLATDFTANYLRTNMEDDDQGKDETDDDNFLQ